MKEDKTIRYYNLNAREFALGTVSVDFEFTQKKFTDRLPKNAAILDFGCGSGRDTKYFLSQGLFAFWVNVSVLLFNSVDSLRA